MSEPKKKEEPQLSLEEAFWTEFIKVKRAIKKLKKDSENPHFKNRYASLEACIDAVNNAIKETKSPLDFAGRNYYAADGLIHSELVLILVVPGLGVHKEVFDCSLPISKMTPQEGGSGISYARRYGIKGTFGMVDTDDDDDGNASSSEGYDNRNPAHKAWLTDKLEKEGVPDSLWAPIAAKMIGRPSSDLTQIIKEVFKR